MRNVLLGLFSAFFLLHGGMASAQIVTQNGKDTSIGNYTSGADFAVYNRIKSATSTPITVRWSVQSHNLGTGNGWELTAGSSIAGICDNNLCYSAGTRDDPFAGKLLTSNPYDNGSFEKAENDFHVIFGTNNPAVGSSAYVRIYMEDLTGGTNRTLTFIATKNPTGIGTVSSSDDIVLYPNPARDAVNVIYDPNSGVKTIAVFNLIGKLVGPIYKPATNGSAKINLNDMPAGVYFMRLMDNHGRVVATRRFAHQ